MLSSMSLGVGYDSTAQVNRLIYRKLLGITYREMKTNEYIKGVMISLIGTYEPILQSIRRRKLKWYGHTSRHDNISKTILQGWLKVIVNVVDQRGNGLMTSKNGVS